jgi:hypothetical protein
MICYTCSGGRHHGRRRILTWSVGEIADCRGDFVAMRLERKVAGVEETHLRARNVAPEGLRTRRQEEGVVLAPNRQA